MIPAIQFFEALFKGQTGVLELRTFDHPDAQKIRDFIQVTDGKFEELRVERFLGETEKRKLGAFFGVALRTQQSLKDKKGDGAHCQVLTVLFVDCDFKHQGKEETDKRIAEFPFPPSLIVSSGGGYHLYWLIRVPYLLQHGSGMKDAQSALRRMAATIADVVDESVSEPVRVLRIPGSFNFKKEYENPRPVTLDEITDIIYAVEDIVPPETVDDKAGPQQFTIPDDVKKGDRHGILFRLLRSQKARGLSLQASLASCHAENLVKCNPVIDHDVLESYLRRCWEQDDRPGFGPAKNEDIIARLNEKYATISIGNKRVVMENGVDGSITELWDFAEFKKLLCKEKMVVRTTTGNGRVKESFVPVADNWLAHAKGRAYERLVYVMPGSVISCTSRDYNGWLGFSVKPQQGDWDLNKGHLLNIICNGRQDYYDWVFNWVAALVQEPGRHAMTAIVLRGGQGTGKGHFAHQMVGLLFGSQQYMHIIGANQLTAEFNEHLSGKAYIFADESTWGGDPKAAAKLKGLITEDTVPINRKFLKMIDEPSNLHICIASNNEWPIPIDKDDRRMTVLDVGDSKRQDDSYFLPLRKELYSGGQSAFLYDLLEHKVDHYALRHPLQTEAKRDISTHSLTAAERWWLEKLHTGSLDNGLWPERIMKAALHADYIQFLDIHHKGREKRSTETELGTFLNKKMGIRSQQRMIGGVRNMYVDLPSLAVCRELWLKNHAGYNEYKWGEDE